jgi:hypothetical protein
MARYGPVATDTSQVALGLAQIRVGSSSTNIAKIEPQLAAADSIGSLASTKYIGNADWYKLEGGFPLIEEYTVPIRETAAMECAFRQISPETMALAHGIDISSGSYEAHSGEVALGGRTAPAYIRMEALYTYPNGTNTMTIIFPRAQVAASVEMDLQGEDAAAVPITFESKNASSDVTDGNAVWDDKPLGRIVWT